jgi:hypothetical protein
MTQTQQAIFFNTTPADICWLNDTRTVFSQIIPSIFPEIPLGRMMRERYVS